MSKKEQKLVYKIALGIEYDGSKYCGWQRQNKKIASNAISIQEKVEKALTQIANEPISVFCASRTDAGVHSTGQVVHFKTVVERKNTAWTFGVNANLPDNIAVRWAKIVPNDFHARFSAISRRYRYVIYNQLLRPAIMRQGITHLYKPLNAERMHRAAQFLLGENDFTSFRSIKCQSHSPWRNVMHIYVVRRGSYVIVDIKANAFLYRMVRNIVGNLIEVGISHRPEKWIADLLTSKNRKLAACTAKAEGLYLVAVNYPDHFNIPQSSMGPFCLPD